MTARAGSARAGTGRRTAPPVLGGGIAAGVLTAVATTKPLARAEDVPADLPLAAAPPAELPLASALALVVLAAWGVALVARGRARRAVLALGLAAAVGVLATLAAGAGSLPDEAREAYAGSEASVQSGLTAWFPVAVAGALASIGALALAVRLCPAWPEMGSRYDAPLPTAAGGAGAPTGGGATGTDDAGNLDTWRALDEGRDPTDPGS